MPSVEGDRSCRGRPVASIGLRRGVDALACLALLFQVARLSGSSVIPIPAIGLVAPALAGGAFILLSGVALTDRTSTLARFEISLLGLTCLAVVLDVVAVLHFAPPYQTDEAALLQASGALVLHGRDPYGVNLASAYSAFHVPIFRLTPLASGGVVRLLDYPGLAVLLAAAAVWLTHGYQSVVAADTAAVVAATMLAFGLLPPSLRGLAVVATLALPGLIQLALGGFVSVLCLPFLVAAVWRWDHTGRTGRLGLRRSSQAVALGLACAISQVAWLMAPFLLLVIWRENWLRFGWSGGTQIVIRIGFIAGVSFAAVNLPFVIAAPHAWLANVGAPLTQPAIPYGLGVAVLPLAAHVGGGYLRGYSIAAALLYMTLLAAAWLWLEKLRPVVLVLPFLPLLVSTRALAEYWLLMVPVWGVAAAAIGPGFEVPPAQPRGRHKGRMAGLKLVTMGLTLAAAVELGVALASPPPLSVKITSVVANGKSSSSSEITVFVTNGTTGGLAPHFFISTQAGPMAWIVRRGPHLLGPHTRTPDIAA